MHSSGNTPQALRDICARLDQLLQHTWLQTPSVVDAERPDFMTPVSDLPATRTN
jgi:hypothetical protein